MIRLTVTICLILGLGAEGSQAFFPSPTTMAERVDSRLALIESMQVEVSFPEHPQWTIRVWKKDSAWRQEWVRQGQEATSVAAAGVGQERRLKAAYPDLQRFPRPIVSLWYDQPVQAWWQEWGIIPDKMDFAFVHTRPCLVLGGLSADSQAWIDHETSLPLKLVTGEGVSCVWRDYRNIGNHRLPHAALLSFSGGTELRVSLAWRGINTRLPQRLFERQAFYAHFPRSEAAMPELPADLHLLWKILPPAWITQ